MVYSIKARIQGTSDGMTACAEQTTLPSSAKIQAGKAEIAGMAGVPLQWGSVQNVGCASRGYDTKVVTVGHITAYFGTVGSFLQ